MAPPLTFALLPLYVAFVPIFKVVSEPVPFHLVAYIAPPDCPAVLPSKYAF